MICSFNAESQSVQYPDTINYFDLLIEGQRIQMAFMDVKPSSSSNSKTVLLLLGKNFNGYYWKDVIRFLTSNGYRVIVPEQVGWGRSSKPNIHYSFHLLAFNTKKLLDSLNIDNVNVIGHSMGGMLAARFSLLYPEIGEKLILENPIGLEDYKTFCTLSIYRFFIPERKKSDI